jgi:hypothetical protein
MHIDGSTCLILCSEIAPLFFLLVFFKRQTANNIEACYTVSELYSLVHDYIGL